MANNKETKPPRSSRRSAPNEQENKDVGHFTYQGAGTVVITAHTEREAVLYGVFDTELEGLDEHNKNAKSFFSYASAAATSAIAMFIQARTGQCSVDAAYFLYATGLAFSVLAIVMGLAGRRANKKYGNRIEEIKKRSIIRGKDQKPTPPTRNIASIPQ